MASDLGSGLQDEFNRREQEREQYYGERYDAVLDELKLIRQDQQKMLKWFDTIEKKEDDTKAASEHAHKEIIERLERLEQNMK